MLLYLLLVRTVSATLLSDETLARRSLTRFMRNHSDHAVCWERYAYSGRNFSVLRYETVLKIDPYQRKAWNSAKEIERRF
jgi:hypothetical protein